jgi:hypothetical protein
VNLKGRIGFLSVPSIYFALPDDVRAEAFCFDVSVRHTDMPYAVMEHATCHDPMP